VCVCVCMYVCACMCVCVFFVLQKKNIWRTSIECSLNVDRMKKLHRKILLVKIIGPRKIHVTEEQLFSFNDVKKH